MICIIYGTRPEFIKMVPLINEFNLRKIPIQVLSTGQHESMLDELYELFKVYPDVDLQLWRETSSLAELNGKLIPKLFSFFEANDIKDIFIQGDTATTFCSAYAGFLNKSKIYHLEAGLRTYNKYSPWPEEINRKLVTAIADINFCATDANFHALINEGVQEDKCLIVGNTIIDSVQTVVKLNIKENLLDEFKLVMKKEYILVTGHRRENWGDGIAQMCDALKLISSSKPEMNIIFCCHPNPNIRKEISKILDGQENIFLYGPQRYDVFIQLIKKSSLIISDSGGIQEEITALNKRMLITRDTTERQEAIDSGHALLSGTNATTIHEMAIDLLSQNNTFEKDSPFGRGDTSKLIVDFFENNN